MNMDKRKLMLLAALGLSGVMYAQTWIWYPGDYEIWLGNRMNNRRTERGSFFPPFWKTDSHYVVVEFSKEVNLSSAETIRICAEGRYSVKLDGKLQFGMPDTFKIPAGRHKLNIKVWNQTTPPTIFVDGRTIKSDSSWKVTNEDKEWIDESGKASDTSTTVYMNAGQWNFNDAASRPSAFRLNRKVEKPVRIIPVKGGTLYDFGKETFGYLSFTGLKGEGRINIYYGESREEALDTMYCETLDKLEICAGKIKNLTDGVIYNPHDHKTGNGTYIMDNSKAFRYVYVAGEGAADYGEVSMLYEYAPEEYRGQFSCNDEELNRIWNVGAYTMHLTTREFFIDGIKRDRWVWSGDAIQSYLMNYYLFFDSDCVKRTIWLLRGKDPVTSHINTIMDYTFYWFQSVYDYYMYTGDRDFLVQLYPRMKSLMAYVLGRTDADGMVEGMAGDWVFIDWADGYLSKKGQLSFEQVLFCKSLETMALCAGLTGEKSDENLYHGLFSALRSKLIPHFWNKQRKALVHAVENGKQSDEVTRYANMFAVLFDYLSPSQKTEVRNSILKNDRILKITTPYMRFYELEALCALGDRDMVMKEMKSYWGGMLKEGATTFWEKYNPSEKKEQHLAMYGRPYGKSLCHAWGASPIYLLGKYYLGVRPVKPGYEEFAISPSLGGLKWIKGDVPVPGGKIHVYMDKRIIEVSADKGSGYLYFNSSAMPEVSSGQVEMTGDGAYKLWIPAGSPKVTVRYR